MFDMGKHDLKAGFLVFLIALPLCLGIAMASGFPPIAGVLTAIIGGTVATFLGSAPLSIKGPAAGLIVIVLGAVHELGQGDMVMGYKKTLAVGAAAAVIQILLSLGGAAAIGLIMSPSVVHGMLAAIGVIIIAKQSYVLLGIPTAAKETMTLLHSLSQANLAIAIIGVLALLILFAMPHIRNRLIQAIPAPIAVLAFSIPFGLWLGLRPEFLVQLPGSLLDVVTFPDFSALFTGTSIKYMIMFALIGTIESTLSVLAVDSMDPKKRSSNLNRDLLAVGVGNLICSLIGGLPMISEIIRSRANIDAGAKSKMANFYHGLIMLIAITAIPGLLGLIPLAALAAMLIFVGTRLASPRELFHMRDIGRDQLLFFVATLITTLATDLLIGVSVGILLKLILHKWRGATLRSLFYPRLEHSTQNGTFTVFVREAATFSALLGIRKMMNLLPSSTKKIVIDVSDVAIVDHTFLCRIAAMHEGLPGIDFAVHGLHNMTSATPHPFSTRTRTV